MRKGFTIIEIVIAMLIIGILIVPIVLFFNQTIKNYTVGKPYPKTVEVVTDAINEIETLLRQANSIFISEEKSIGFIISIETKTRKIVYELDNGFIVRTDDFGKKYTPYYNNPETPVSESIYLELSFKYYDEKNNSLPYGQPDKVRLVEISIKGSPRQVPQGTINPEFSLTTMVKLRNVK
ncbi:MAG: prepilin-type N-terminal cleavage/methylation domain-containing protein [Caldisericia bacterium]|nr:prepilin-type N-terminal cleavage/methylation domain-containing protein [Caldisericia bacterium]